MNARFNYFAAAIGSSMIWGAFSIPLRNLRGYPSTEILIYRIFTSLLICVLITLLFRRKSLREDWQYLRNTSAIQRRNTWKLIISSSIFITANWFSFIYAINHVSIQSGAFAYMVCPILTALLGFFVLKEHLSPLQWTAILICVGSISFLAYNAATDVAVSVVIALLYSIYLVLQKKIEHLHKFNILLVQLMISTLIILPYYAFSNHHLPTESIFWTNILVISLFFTVIPLFLSLYALIGLPSSTIGIIIYLNPIVAFFVAFFYFDEQTSGSKLVAYLFLLFAVVLFNWHIIRRLWQRA